MTPQLQLVVAFNVSTTMYRVVASNSDTGSTAFELLPNMPILRNKHTSTNNRNSSTYNRNNTLRDNRNQNSVANEMINHAIIVHDSRLYLGQEVYRLHFSIIDKNRSWMRGTKRSIRWYVETKRRDDSLSDYQFGRN